MSSNAARPGGSAGPASGGERGGEGSQRSGGRRRGGTQTERGPATTPSEDNGERDGGAGRGPRRGGTCSRQPRGERVSSARRRPWPSVPARTHPAPDPQSREPGARPQPADRGGARDSGPSRDVGGRGSCAEPGPPSPPLGLGQPLSGVVPSARQGSWGAAGGWEAAALRARPWLRPSRPRSAQGPGLWKEGLGRSGRRGGSEGAAATQRSPGARGAGLGLGPRLRRSLPNCAPRLRQTARQVQTNGLRFIFPPRLLGRAGSPSHPNEGQSPLSAVAGRNQGASRCRAVRGGGRLAPAPGARARRRGP